MFNFIFVFMKDGFVSFVNFIILFIYIYELLCLLLYFIDCHVCQHQILISVSFSRGYLSDQWYDTQLFHILVESSSCKKLCDSFFFVFHLLPNVNFCDVHVYQKKCNVRTMKFTRICRTVRAQNRRPLHFEWFIFMFNTSCTFDTYHNEEWGQQFNKNDMVRHDGYPLQNPWSLIV